ncbi:MAG: MBL fold metallo-hydrolase, partial [Gemmatimonadales bacterium]
AFNVVSTLVYGPTELLLVDAQFRMSDGKRVADKIAATGRRLTAIFITHPDEDHSLGAQAILARFPGTPVYMTAAAVEDFARSSPAFLKMARGYLKDDAPDSIVQPRPIPSNHFKVDGEDVEVVPDLQGDVIARTNSFLYIPSMSAVIAGDIVFSGVHPYLAHSTEATRAEWQNSLGRIEAFHPRYVVPGHKRSIEQPDTRESLTFMSKYLRDFDAARLTAANPEALIGAMRTKYPDLGMPLLLVMSSRSAFAPK